MIPPASNFLSTLSQRLASSPIELMAYYRIDSHELVPLLICWRYHFRVGMNLTSLWLNVKIAIDSMAQSKVRGRFPIQLYSDVPQLCDPPEGRSLRDTWLPFSYFEST